MHQNLLEPLLATAMSRPDTVSVRDSERALTYAELLRHAHAVGEELDPGEDRAPTALLLDKTVDAVVGIVAVLLRAGVYSPLDVDLPAAPLQAVLDNLRPSGIVTSHRHDSLLEQLDLRGVDLIFVEEVDPDPRLTLEVIAQTGRAANSRIIDTDPVYVIHTSGSTGRPKGVTTSHGAVLDFINWAVAAFDIGPKDRIGNQAPLHFDNSTLDVYSAFATGATLVLLPDHLFSFPLRLAQSLRESHITVILWVPSALVQVADRHALDNVQLPDMRWVLFAGEVMPARQLAYWMRSVPGSRYANLYGPTEITVHCTYHVVDDVPDDNDVLPLGRPCRNSDVLILTDEGTRAAANQVGELCVRGVGVALGYYGDPELTARVFVQNPLHNNYRDIVYRTGDMATYDDHGIIHFCGRRDQQIKHLGYRVELGAIEAAANSLPGVKQSAAVYDEARRTVCLLVAGSGPIEPEQVRRSLLDLLPKYMVPRRLDVVDQMPLNRNRKIDRRAVRDRFVPNDAGGIP